MSHKKTKEQIITEAKKIHKDKYIYDEVEYVNSHTPIKIICKLHGPFWQKPNAHISGKQGCPICGRILAANKNSKSFSQFMEEARKVHGDKYEYDESTYTIALKKMRIICPEHGEFWQTPNHHLVGVSCPKCAIKQRSNKVKKTFEQFVEDARKVHGDKYIYNDSNYQGNKASIGITCPKHGEFFQRVNDHLNGEGCPKCKAEKNGYSKRLGFLVFKERAEKVHNNKYIYNDSNYINNRTPITITCPIHGDFLQTPNDHLNGSGCPHCGHTISKAEEEIYQFLCQFIPSDDIIRHDKNVLNGLEIDILLPTFKLGIEFNGLRWHSEKFNKNKNYHVDKTNLAESKGYHLIQIFEDEWIEHKNIVLNKLRHFIGKDGDKVRIGARKCLVEPVSKDLAMDFLSKYHIQGFAGSTIYLGGYYNGELMAVMSFKQEQPDMWNLTRYASNTDYLFPGLANKIVHYFIKEYNPVEIKTFLDRRWSHGDVNVYDRMGFKLVETLAPDYRYIDGNERKHKFGFRKNMLHKKYGVSLDLTEREMTEQLGFERIWDCGLYKYVWTKAEN